jgi:hypothetical protein
MNTRAIRMTTPKNPSIVIAISTSRAKRSPRTRKGKCQNLFISSNEPHDILRPKYVIWHILNMKTTFILPESESKFDEDMITQPPNFQIFAQFLLTIIQTSIFLIFLLQTVSAQGIFEVSLLKLNLNNVAFINLN